MAPVHSRFLPPQNNTQDQEGSQGEDHRVASLATVRTHTQADAENQQQLQPLLTQNAPRSSLPNLLASLAPVMTYNQAHTAYQQQLRPLLAHAAPPNQSFHDQTAPLTETFGFHRLQNVPPSSFPRPAPYQAAPLARAFGFYRHQTPEMAPQRSLHQLVHHKTAPVTGSFGLLQHQTPHAAQKAPQNSAAPASAASVSIGLTKTVGYREVTVEEAMLSAWEMIRQEKAKKEHKLNEKRERDREEFGDYGRSSDDPPSSPNNEEPASKRARTA